MFYKKCLKFLFIGVLVGVMLFSGVISVLAASTSGNRGYYTVNGVNYYNQSDLTLGWQTPVQRFARAGVTAARDDTGSVPAGWMGVMPRLIQTSNGNIAASSDWGYNTISAGKISGYATKSNMLTAVTYYSQGHTRAWNGSSYVTYNTFATPSSNDYS